MHASLYQSTISPRSWYFKKSLTRKEIVLINRIRSNHYNLNLNMFQKNIVNSAACPCGDPKQDINHIVFSCPITTPKSFYLKTYLSDFFTPLNNCLPNKDICQITKNSFSSLKSLIIVSNEYDKLFFILLIFGTNCTRILI